MDLAGIHQRVSGMADKMGHKIPALESVRRIQLEPGGRAEQAQEEFQTLLSMDNVVFNGHKDLDSRVNQVKHQYSPSREAQIEISSDKTRISYEEISDGKRGLMESLEAQGAGMTWCTVTENNGRLIAEIFSTPDATTDAGFFETWYFSGR